MLTTRRLRIFLDVKDLPDFTPLPMKKGIDKLVLRISDGIKKQQIR